MAKTLLEMKNIVKLFPGVRALDNVNLKVEEGEVHALVGENGAGKSTLMNVLSGIYPYGSYEGDILYNGEVCQFKTIKDSEAKGIVIIHQELALVPYLSIGENMFLGNERGSKARIDWDETYHRADELLRQSPAVCSVHRLARRSSCTPLRCTMPPVTAPRAQASALRSFCRAAPTPKSPTAPVHWARISCSGHATSG